MGLKNNGDVERDEKGLPDQEHNAQSIIPQEEEEWSFTESASRGSFTDLCLTN